MRERERVGRRGLPGAADRGSGTVLTLSVVAAILLVAALLGLVAGALAAHARAQGAADLGALAAASRLQRQTLFGSAEGDGTPCALAGTVVVRNGARVTRCSTEAGGAVMVGVAADGPTGAVGARARAGPRSPASAP